jgi:hypothetical protein
MVNQNLQQQAEEEDKPFHKQTLVFQPVEVGTAGVDFGVLRRQ